MRKVLNRYDLKKKELKILFQHIISCEFRINFLKITILRPKEMAQRVRSLTAQA